MKTTNLPLSKLIAYAGNPRKNDHAVEAVASAIKRFGFRVPVLAKSDGSLIDGHLRVKAAKHLGMEEVPVVLCDDLSEADIKALRISINRMAELAEWDSELLSAELEGLAAEGFSIEDLGFDAAALEELGADLGLEENPDVDAEPQIDKAEELRAKWGVEPGQLWELGDHRLLCGDSTKKEDVDRVMGGERANAMFTDPPYAIYGSSTGVSSSVADDKMVRPFFRDILSVAKQHTKPFAHLYICCDFRSWASWWEIAKDVGLQVKNCIVWDKKSPGMGSMYQNQHEFVMFAVNYYQQTAHMAKRDTGQRLVAGETNVWQIGRAPVKERQHNATKPTELVTRALENSCEIDDVVIEPFSGSGTTIIACEQLGRKCRAIEISPAYVAVALQRWADATGKTPKLAA